MINATIGDIASVQTGPFGSQLHNKDYVLVGTPIVTVEHLGERKMTRQNLPCVSETDKKRLSKYMLRYGDLVFSRVGSVDRCSWVSEEEDGWMFSGRCLRVRPNNPSEIYHKYLYYFFSLESTKDFVRSIAVGATMPSINTRLLSEVPFTFPGIKEQREIGDTLSALDDRIEANRKVNHHLEQMAQAIFKSWFVDFEPFGGVMPADWHPCVIGDLSTEINTRLNEELGLEVLSAIKTGELIPSNDYFTKQVYSKELTRYKVVEPNDFAYNPMRINIGSIGANQRGKTCCVSPDYVVFRANKGFHLFLRLVIKSSNFLEAVNTFVSGSVRQRVYYKQLKMIETICPDNDTLVEFNQIYGAIIAKINEAKRERANLADLRDILLPRLMSGELSVSDLGSAK